MADYRGIRQLFGKFGVGRFRQIAIESNATPVYPPFHIKASAAPTADDVFGDLYVNATSGLMLSDGVDYRRMDAYKPIVGTAAATLTAADSGATIMFNNATGYAVTLPPAAAGLWFDVMVNVTVSSGVARLACATGDFFRGTLLQGTDTTYLPAARTANGTSHLAWEGNGSTTSGIAGDAFRIVAVDDTIWQVMSLGILSASGTEATFWKTT